MNFGNVSGPRPSARRSDHTGQRRAPGRRRAAVLRRQRAVTIAGVLVILLAGAAASASGGARGAAASLIAGTTAALLLAWADSWIRNSRGTDGEPEHRQEDPMGADPADLETETGSSAPPVTAEPASTGRGHFPSAPASAAPPAPPAERPPASPPAPPPAPPAERAHRAAGRFPQPLGKSGMANALPWRLPPEPGPSGVVADGASVGDLRVRAASIIGPGHRCEEPAVPRQDAYRLAVDRERRHLIVAVADGMSSSPHSDLGAGVATMTLVQQLWPGGTDAATDATAHRWFTEAARHMAAAAHQRGLEHDQVCAAALVALIEIDPAADGSRRVRTWTIADVGAWLRTDRAWQQVAGDVRTGLDRSKLKVFLPHHPNQAVGASFRLEPGAVLALTTDGVGDALGRADLGPWFADRWSEPPHVSDFVDDVGFEAKGELDDRTAVVVWSPGTGAHR